MMTESELIMTSRPTPVFLRAATRWRVPSVLVLKNSSRCRHFVAPAAWMTTSNRCGLSASSSWVSDERSSSMKWRRGSVRYRRDELRRMAHHTSHPLQRASSAMCEPMKPDAPVISIFIVLMSLKLVIRGKGWSIHGDSCRHNMLEGHALSQRQRRAAGNEVAPHYSARQKMP